MSTIDNKNERQNMYRQNHVLIRVKETIEIKCRREGLAIDARYRCMDGSSYRNFLIDVLEIAKENIPETQLRQIIESNYEGMRISRIDKKIGFLKTNLRVEATATPDAIPRESMKRRVDEIYEEGEDKSLAKLTSIKNDMNSDFTFFLKDGGILRSEIQQTLSIVCNKRTDAAVTEYLIEGNSHVDKSINARDCMIMGCGLNSFETRVDVDDRINDIFTDLARRLKEQLAKYK